MVCIFGNASLYHLSQHMVHHVMHSLHTILYHAIPSCCRNTASFKIMKWQNFKSRFPISCAKIWKCIAIQNNSSVSLRQRIHLTVQIPRVWKKKSDTESWKLPVRDFRNSGCLFRKVWQHFFLPSPRCPTSMQAY